jgi:DNA-directed RNA polymerase subunit RPC12/RpoP
MDEFFRHCPGCGRRFHVKLESKNLVNGHVYIAPAVTGSKSGGGRVVFDVDEFQYNYKCSICGHEWSEKRVEDEPE